MMFFIYIITFVMQFQHFNLKIFIFLEKTALKVIDPLTKHNYEYIIKM